jgi:hypothetical protein
MCSTKEVWTFRMDCTMTSYSYVAEVGGKSRHHNLIVTALVTSFYNMRLGISHYIREGIVSAISTYCTSTASPPPRSGRSLLSTRRQQQ